MKGSIERRPRGNHFFTVDIDVHIHEEAAQLAEYCENPWSTALRTTGKIRERYLDLPGLSPGGGGYDPVFPGGQPLRFVRSARQLRKELNALGVDIGIMFPDHLLKIAMFPDPEYSMVLARAYNRWLIERWLGKEKGLFGALCIAPQNPLESAEEIKRLGRMDNNMACVYMPVAGLDRLYGNREYDPVYEAAEKIGIPLVLHSVSVTHPVFPFQLEQYPTEFARHALSHPLGMIANMIHMIATGVPVRFPKLRVCFAEGAISWVPWVMMRLDKEYLERRREVPFLEERPSHYIQRCGFGTQPIEEPERASDYLRLLELIGGPDSVMFASDWPHHDFDHPSKILSYPIPDESKKRIMGQNALDFFKLPAANGHGQ